MPITRTFIGFDEQILPWLASSLISRANKSPFPDLSQITVVVPGGRALRRLLSLLVQTAEDLKISSGIVPPKIITRGALIDRFLPAPPKPLASEISRQIAWISALQNADSDTLSQLTLPAEPSTLETSSASLARRLDSLYVETSAAGLTFKDVAQKGAEVEGFYEEERWSALHQLYLGYLDSLNNAGLSCPYERRSQQLAEIADIQLPGALYLCGLLELNSQQKSFLDRCRGEINSIIFADKDNSEGFDSYGAILPDYWEQHNIPLKNSQVQVVEHPRELAPACAEWLSQLAPNTPLNEIVIGLGDETLAPYLKGRLDDLSVETRAASGINPSLTQPGFFISAIFNYLEGGSFNELALLIRHPYVSSWLSSTLRESLNGSSDVLRAIDSYQQERLQSSTRGSLPGDKQHERLAIKTIAEVEEWLKPLRGAGLLTTVEWAQRIFKVFEPFSQVIAKDYPEILEALNEILDELSSCTLDATLKSGEVLGIVIDHTSERAQIPDRRESGIELLGWLELLLDDASALLITGLAEGTVPGVTNSDPFLPDSLSSHIGLTNNRSRFARDIALFHALAHSKRHLKIVNAKRALSGETVIPSRLLLALDERDLPARVDLFKVSGERYHRHTASAKERKNFLVAPPAQLLEPIVQMTTTSFASYMRCPYRFYLERVIKALPVGDHKVELDAAQFGTLAHEILAKAGRDAAFNSTDEMLQQELLDDTSSTLFRERFGDNALPALRIQLAQLQARFRYFIKWQVEHRRDGWITKETERDLAANDLVIDLPDGPMVITGRIDRIDHNAPSDSYLILDYKTADKAQSALRMRSKREDLSDDLWTDLQAPLYLIAGKNFFGEQAKLAFGYINISSETTSDIFEGVDLLASDLESALKQATGIASLVRRQIFWPPAENQIIEPANDPYWRVLMGLSQNGIISLDDEASDE
jgi:ATP-dependent helicase/nuclease subunit B